ncbi:glycosyltransferase family 76 protein [Hebeloma cylindrosporum]|uniref:GPI mannosyltransferase 2 n=1 Tax=Hebeloma cylindrosporum TaxID=76867 RepID=A0A0C3C8L6_HEBCY|nr:glycosyltransferase family 76 protein [Hebeloma cylindrosporum h7]
MLSHRGLILRYALLSRLVFFVILQFAALLPLFDASPILVALPRPLRPLLRWDAFHFLHVANHGYVYEHEWAFFPGSIYLIRYLGSILGHLTGFDASNFFSAGLLAVLACDTSQTLYALSLHHLQSPALALSASLLSLLPTSPATLYFAPYNEPFFTYFTYRGMLCCARQQWLKASLFFALASSFRSNGVLLSGFIFWGLIAEPCMAKQVVSPFTKSLALAAIVIAPFIAYHLAAYAIFCSGTGSSPEWCSQFPPSIYTHAQSTYWNVGFLRYWTLGQLPNFILAIPTLLLILSFAVYHLKGTWLASSKRKGDSQLDLSFRNVTITPHAIHAIILSFILIFASHTQIVLRLAASMPFVYWAAAWLVCENPALGRLWVSWSVLWGTTSTICWATFLPPA